MNWTSAGRAWLLGSLRAIGGAAIGGFLAMVLATVYFFVTPGAWYIHSESPVAVADALVGDNIPFKWCRNPVFGAIDATGIRTFYRADSSGKFDQVAEYRFKASIEPTKEPCPGLNVLSTRQPQEPGTYYFVTDYSWRELFFDKSLRVESGTYNIDATPASLKERLKQLEGEVKSLRQRLQALSHQSSTAGAVMIVPTTQPTTGVVRQPTTSAPPDPSARGNQAPASQAGNPLVDVRPLLDTTTNTVRQTLKQVRGVL